MKTVHRILERNLPVEPVVLEWLEDNAVVFSFEDISLLHETVRAMFMCFPNDETYTAYVLRFG